MTSKTTSVAALAQAGASVTASVLMLALVALSFPLPALAQEASTDTSSETTTSAPVEETTEASETETTPIEQEVVIETEVETETETPVKEETSVTAEAVVTEDASSTDEARDGEFFNIAPKLTVKKVLINDDGGTAATSSFAFTVTKHRLILPDVVTQYSFEEDGENVISVDSFHLYTVEEVETAGYEATYSEDCNVFISLIGKTCTVTNDDVDQTPNPETATISATKIVCDTEASLPNWGAGAPDVTADTAATFLAEHAEDCESMSWTFEWAQSDAANPGDATGVAGGAWTSFPNGTVEVPAGSLIWVREQADADYIPFSGQNTTESVSAELYCSTDGYNYDNYDFIDPVVAGETYHCVAFNAPVTVTEPAMCVIVSDTKTLEGGEAASIVTSPSSYWTAIIDGASWIWGEDPVATPEVTTTETFTRTFTLDSIPSSASLELAVDDAYVVSVNINEVASDEGLEAVNFTEEGKDTISIPTESLVIGENTLTIKAINLTFEGATVENNPAGLKYKLTLMDANCIGGSDNGGPSGGDNNGGNNGGNNHRSSRRGSVAGNSTEGEVLGAACPILTQYMRETQVNDEGEVIKLKTFLNGELGTKLDENGIFDEVTTLAVNAFQIKYWEDVLLPWVPYGLPTAQTPTGYVYKTTLHKINEIACPDLNAPEPQLP